MFNGSLSIFSAEYASNWFWFAVTAGALISLIFYRSKQKANQSVLSAKTLMNTVKDYAIFMLDVSGRITMWNEGVDFFKGYEKREIAGKHFSIFYTEEDIQSGKPDLDLKTAVAAGRFEEEAWRIRKDHSRFWASITLSTIKGPDGTVTGFSSVIRDLTEKKNRDEILRRADLFLESILENIPNMVFVKEASSLRFVRLNRAGERLLGYSRGEILGKNDYDFFPPEQADHFTSNDRTVLSGSVIVDIPEELIETSHGTRTLHTRKIPIFGNSGKAEYLLGIAEDITEWKMAQEERLKVFGEKIALEERERATQQTAFLADITTLLASSFDYHATLKRLSNLLVESMATWCTITLVDEDQNIERVAATHRNPDKQALLQRMVDEVPIKMNDRDESRYIEVIRTGKIRHRPLIQESELQNEAQNEKHLELLRALGCVSLIIVPIKIRDTVHGAIAFISANADKFYGVQDVAIAEEIGKRAATAIENAKLYEAVQKAVQSRDEFLSIASHELKTPLTALKLQLEFARRQTKPEENTSPTPEKMAKMLDTSGAQVNRLALLVDDLLDVSRIEAGKLNFNFETVDLVALTADVAERYKEHITAAGCTLELSLPKTPLFVSADRFRMEQVILNILSNAAKYGSKSLIEVSAEQRGDLVRIQCRDHGIGIPPGKTEKIFERFERAIEASHISGLGLGLYIAHEIVCAHDGNIRAESKLNEGSVFTVDIPILKEQVL